jgi:hypothetical protein
MRETRTESLLLLSQNVTLMNYLAYYGRNVKLILFALCIDVGGSTR